MKLLRTLNLELLPRRLVSSKLGEDGRNLQFATLNVCSVIVALVFITCNDCTAQIQQAWAAHYNNGIMNGTNQAVKMALDPSGNIYVTGFSQNANSNLGYVTMKYAPNGTQLWAARYDSTNYPTATPSGLVLDGSNNVIVTGSALTIKYDTNGNQVWTAPYAGNTIAINADGDSFVTGYESGFNTVKISSNGTNLWSASYISSFGPVISQAIVVDGGGNSYVAGSDTYICVPHGNQPEECYNELLLVKYDKNGNQLWENLAQPPSVPTVEIAGLALDSSANVYVLANPYSQPYSMYCYASNGSSIWTASPDNGTGPANGLALDSNRNVFLVGQDAYAFGAEDNYIYYSSTFKLNSGGTTIWTNNYPQPPAGSSAATSVAVDSGGNAYITGYSSGANSSNGIVTIKYGSSGNQIWVQRYNGPGNGDDEGNAIAVDNNGNVYVAGYDTTMAGGTEMVLIKYSPVTLQRKPNGTVLLEAQGFAGESFDIEASVDLLNWLDLGTVLADTNGFMQFDDTNAPNFPSRFYYTNPQ